MAENRIRQLREDKDLRQIDVAESTGIDQRTLSNYETGKTNPDSYAIIQLAKFYGVSCDYLLGLTDYNIIDMKDLAEELKKLSARIDSLQKYISRK
jgi:transcriptional regulator with XRE-family HTH domain